MKTGDVVHAKTHAKLLNYLLKTNYKQWHKCTYDLEDNVSFIWMVCLDGTNTDGHQNYFESDDTIIEQFDKDKIKNTRFRHGLDRQYRLVFEKLSLDKQRIYKFHGVYRLANVLENGYTRILKKVSDDYDF